MNKGRGSAENLSAARGGFRENMGACFPELVWDKGTRCGAALEGKIAMTQPMEQLCHGERAYLSGAGQHEAPVQHDLGKLGDGQAHYGAP